MKYNPSLVPSTEQFENSLLQMEDSLENISHMQKGQRYIFTECVKLRANFPESIVREETSHGKTKTYFRPHLESELTIDSGDVMMIRSMKRHHRYAEVEITKILGNQKLRLERVIAFPQLIANVDRLSLASISDEEAAVA